MPGEKPKSLPPFSLRLSQAERKELEQRAQGGPIGTYIRKCLFGDERDLHAPHSLRKVLAQVLAKLGQSEMASNIASLVEAVRSGSLVLTPETEQALRQALDDISAMKTALMAALGIKER